MANNCAMNSSYISFGTDVVAVLSRFKFEIILFISEEMSVGFIHMIYLFVLINC